MLSSDLAEIVVEVAGSDVYFTLKNEHNIGKFIYMCISRFFILPTAMQGMMGVNIPTIFGEPELTEDGSNGRGLSVR